MRCPHRRGLPRHGSVVGSPVASRIFKQPRFTYMTIPWHAVTRFGDLAEYANKLVGRLGFGAWFFGAMGRQSLSVVVMAATIAVYSEAHGSQPDRIWNVINGRAADAGDVLRDVRGPLSSAAQPLVWPFNGPHPSMAGLATCAAGAKTAQRRISAPPETLSHRNPAQRLGQTRRAVSAMPIASDYAWFACSDVTISFLPVPLSR